MISYKAKEQGITVKLTEESCTSGTSFLDENEPNFQNYNKKRRKYRGLFYANDNTFINAAYQIMKKVVPMQRDSGCVTPVYSKPVKAE